MKRASAEHMISRNWAEILDELGVDAEADGLAETPRRAARALLELTSGYDVDIAGLFKVFESNGYDEMVVVRDITFASLCEHHVLPFTGVAHIAYIPNGKIVGLSKLGRLVEAYSRRLQVQERLTVEIAEAMMQNLDPQGVAVVLEATHSCMALRGVRKPGATMVTSVLRGAFMDKPAARAEVLALLRGGK